MSKDKGSKNHKKAPADNKGKDKHQSSYKSETKSGAKPYSIDAFAPKDTDKPAGGKKA